MKSPLAEFELPSDHYQQAISHEAATVALLLVDRKLARLLTLRPDECVDLFWRERLRLLIRDPFASVRAVVAVCGEAHAARTITDVLRCPATGMVRVFDWNFEWHQSEVRRLARVRQQFLESLDFIREHAA